VDEQARLDGLIDRYSPEVARDARRALAIPCARLPTATRLVYDNYNALAVGFSPNEKASDAILSVALFPRYSRLFFLRGMELEDPHRLLEGKGSAVRSIRLEPVSLLATPEVLALVEAATARARPPLPETGEGPVIIKSISARQRPRRPGG
jgi:hypothetical protein